MHAGSSAECACAPASPSQSKPESSTAGHARPARPSHRQRGRHARHAVLGDGVGLLDAHCRGRQRLQVSAQGGGDLRGWGGAHLASSVTRTCDAITPRPRSDLRAQDALLALQCHCPALPCPARALQCTSPPGAAPPSTPPASGGPPAWARAPAPPAARAGRPPLRRRPPPGAAGGPAPHRTRGTGPAGDWREVCQRSQCEISAVCGQTRVYGWWLRCCPGDASTRHATTAHSQAPRPHRLQRDVGGRVVEAAGVKHLQRGRPAGRASRQQWVLVQRELWTQDLANWPAPAAHGLASAAARVLTWTSVDSAPATASPRCTARRSGGGNTGGAPPRRSSSSTECRPCRACISMPQPSNSWTTGRKVACGGCGQGREGS